MTHHGVNSNSNRFRNRNRNRNSNSIQDLYSICIQNLYSRHLNLYSLLINQKKKKASGPV